MARANVGSSVEELRDAVRRRAETSSLRQTAADIGMSWSGLRTFLTGTDPHPRTLRKVSEWYLRQSSSVQRADAAGAELALNVLIEHAPATQRQQLKHAIIDTIRQFAEQGNTPAPSWLRTATKRKSK